MLKLKETQHAAIDEHHKDQHGDDDHDHEEHNEWATIMTHRKTLSIYLQKNLEFNELLYSTHYSHLTRSCPKKAKKRPNAKLLLWFFMPYACS